ncbi:MULTISPECIES: SIS domain-containing protein [unclassified Lentimicrobium]|uniref:D-sedoheptulose-7-phosphate isomerase n=1 Tax=unclassified Lentimicrobium TaxID=2677434 RepID=UPI00155792D5|nr:MULTISPECIES: D-sedoheptulose 7-phosphate isomerase [unclassified Lentimicrobium]NPD46852.1 D-sedoheptulose 7-phosphate isomerase [Lentimicrobium sp. S6]NPD84435.1 D-sedoheptulose 7-phosphate isomerase [Lentimicrobium sp. L6]
MSVEKALKESIELKKTVLEHPSITSDLNILAQKVVDSFKKGGRVYFCGNGGSAADAQHLAAELSGRYYYDRPPLAAEALHVNTSYLTAVANDYSYDEIYARLFIAFGQPADVLIGLSTSGNSKNVIRAFEEANKKGVLTVAFTGETGGKMNEVADMIFKIPSTDTPRIQEVHMLLGHSLCEIVEQKMFPRNDQ